MTRSLKLVNATNVTEEIYQAAVRLFNERLPNEFPPVRLLGVGVSGFDEGSERQPLLFEEQQHTQQRQLDEASDEIREKFGPSSLARGSRLLHQTDHRPLPNTRDRHTGQG